MSDDAVRARAVLDTVAINAGEAAYLALLMNKNASLRDLDLDALADGILAHRDGLGFHENPHRPDAMTRRRLSWAIGWNERALQVRP